MKKILIYSVYLLLSSFLANAQETPPAYSSGIPVNYIRTWNPQIPLQNLTDINQASTPRELVITTQYLDGIGRSLQTVIKQGSLATGGTARDLVNPVYYDEFSHESKQYLPFVSGSNDGKFKNDPFQQQKAFYDNYLSGQGEAYYYAQTNFEASPLGRVEKQMAPGTNWVGSNKGINTKYRINTLNDSVRIWNVTDVADNAGTFGTYSSPANAYYAAGTLYKTVTIDENGKQQIEYNNKNGRTIVKKVQIGSGTDNGSGVGYNGWLCTYYIYDDLNNLRCVIQPEGVKALAASGWQFTTTILDEQCFRYEYNDRNLVIMKKNPGAGAVYFVYDKRDRQVMMQDANMRGSKWLITKYDDLNRPVKTGMTLYNYIYKTFRQLLDEAQNEDIYPFGYSDPPAPYWETYTITHYDDYAGLPSSLPTGLAAYTTAGFVNNNYNTASSGYAQEIKKSDKTKGKITWTQVRPIGASSSSYTADQFIYTVNIYDDNGRIVQTQRSKVNSYSTWFIEVVVTTTQYNWAGKPLYTLEMIDRRPGMEKPVETFTTYNYDDAGRVATIRKKITRDGISAEKTIVKNEYDELGQLKKKTLAPEYNNNAGLETLTYDYNIRGWQLGMNRNFVKNNSTNYFGYDLGYDKAPALIPNTSYLTPQYNGNIAGIIWKSKGDKETRKYDFSYDAVSRLTSANFNQYTNNSFNRTAGVDFSVNNLSYDYNGNILTMNQAGLKAAGNSALIDQLNYTYEAGSNKLKQVTDAVCDPKSVLGDFKYEPGTKTDVDYTYDANGNMKMDNNKKFTDMRYNYLNQLNYVATSSGSSITYDYDGNGNKLVKSVFEIGKGSIVSEYYGHASFDISGPLQLIGHEEGRIRPLTDPATKKITGFAFDYFIKDHLDNVRMVLTDEQKTDVYPAATLEGNINTNSSPNAIALEKNYYDINTANVVDRSQATGIANYTNNNGIDNPNPYSATTANSAKLYKLQATSSGGVTGLSFTAKVMSGDKINIFGKSYYFQNNTGTTNYNIPVTTILTGLLGSTAAAGKATLADLSGNNVITQAISNGLQDAARNNNGTTQTPKAYINYILFDEQFKAVKTGFSRVGNANTVKDHYNELQNIPVEKNGYLYVYCSNESPVPVYFDNLQVTHTRGTILSEDHYYPFGLTMQGLSSQAASFGGTVNKYKFNGGTELGSKEFSDGSGLDFYETTFRIYNPQLGRFNQSDMAASLNKSWSNYSYVNNNPILMNDPLGLWNDSVRTKQGDWAYSNNDGNLQGVIVMTKKKEKWNGDIWGDDYNPWNKGINPWGYTTSLAIGVPLPISGWGAARSLPAVGGGAAGGPAITALAAALTFDYIASHYCGGQTTFTPNVPSINGGGDISSYVPKPIIPDLKIEPLLLNSDQEKTTENILPGSLKKSPSYNDGYGGYTPSQIREMARNGDEVAKKIKKLLDQTERLLDKNKNK